MGRGGLVTEVVDAAELVLDAEAIADDDLLSGPAWGRHPADVARAVLATLALTITSWFALRHAADSRSVTVDLVELVNQLPRWIRDAVLGATQLVAVAVPVVLLLVVRRRPRLLVTIAGAAAAAALLMVGFQGHLDRAVPSRVQLVSERPSWVTGASFPTAAYIAAMTAALVVIAPVLRRGWRRLAAVGLALALTSRVVTAVAAPLNLGVTVALGALVGSATLVAFGSPRRTASRRAVLAGLALGGFPAERIDPIDVGAGNARTFVARSGSGRAAFVKLLGRDERDAAILARVIKRLRVKDLDATRPGWTPAELVEHEAYSALLAGRRGVSVPDVLAAGTTEGGDGIVAQELVAGVPLELLELDDVTDALLDEVWRQVVLLHHQGIAHGWLTTAHFLVDLDAVSARDVATVTLVDHRWATHQADPTRLAADIATLTSSLALVVGAERSVAAAERALGPADLAAALPLVQPLALPADLRKAAKEHAHLLPAVRDRIQASADDVPYELADIERIGWAQLLTLFGGVVMAYVLLSFITSWSAISASMRAVDPGAYLVLAFLMTVPYLTGAGTLMSVSPKPLPFVEVVKLMFAQSFLNRFTPANAGGMALRIRYLQQRGVDLGGAAAGVGLTSVSSGITQVVVLVTFVVWAGASTSTTAFRLPQVSTIAVGVLVITVLGAFVWVTPWGRRVIGDRLVTTVRQVWTTFRDIASQPGRFVVLFGTCTLSKFATITAFTVSCQAMGITIGYPRLGLLYLTASSLASVAPTPGGIGAVEAALTAALTGLGVEPGIALSAVFLFRLMTFWLPVPFGWLAFQRLQKAILE